MKIATSIRLTDAEIREAAEEWLEKHHPDMLDGKSIRDVSCSFMEVYLVQQSELVAQLKASVELLGTGS